MTDSGQKGSRAMLVRATVPLLSAVCLTASLAMAYRGLAPPPTNLRVSASVHDAAEVRQNVVVDAEFQVSNASDRPVEIVDTISNCDCTVAQLKKKTLAPGESTAVHIKCETRANRGKCRTTLALVSRRQDSGVKEALPLHVEADVVPEFQIVPPRVVFGDVEARLTVALVPHLAKTFRITKAYCTRREFNAEIGSSTREVTVHFSPQLQSGVNRDALVGADLIIETTCLNCPACRIPIEWRLGETTR